LAFLKIPPKSLCEHGVSGETKEVSLSLFSPPIFLRGGGQREGDFTIVFISPFGFASKRKKKRAQG
jgi:hypothetical protein